VPLSYKLTLAYLAMVFFGQKWMARRKAFDSPAMSRVLALWNFGFSLFSSYAAYCLLPELYRTIKHRGFVGGFWLKKQKSNNCNLPNSQAPTVTLATTTRTLSPASGAGCS
jgi:hypothetical protein